VLPAADTVTGVLVCQLAEPPVTVGAVGFVRSILTVLPVVGAAGAQSDTFPAPSTDRTCTYVRPSFEIVAEAPATGANHVTPSGDVRVWYPDSPAPPTGSADPAPVTVTDATFCHAAEPPVTVGGALGLVRSILTVTDTQFDVFPTLSVARNRTTVDPSPVTVT